MAAYVRGHHVYQQIWNPVIRELLQCEINLMVLIFMVQKQNHQSAKIIWFTKISVLCQLSVGELFIQLFIKVWVSTIPSEIWHWQTVVFSDCKNVQRPKTSTIQLVTYIVWWILSFILTLLLRSFLGNTSCCVLILRWLLLSEPVSLC